MENSIHDIALDEIHEIRKLVKAELAEQYKKTKPFRMEPVDNDTLLFVYDNMAPEDVQYAVETYGRDEVNEFIFSMEQMKQRRKL